MERLSQEPQLIAAAGALIELCRRKKLTIAAAESCTGGLVAATLTEIPGSSAVFDRGFVTYSNDAKQAMLGVPADVLQKFGAVSRETAQAMADGALAHSPADLAVAITGIAGPGGAMPGKPVGLVHFAAAARDGRHRHVERQLGDIGRAPVRLASVAQALAMLRELADQEAYPA
jgi:nicotinamide-nucleotide amidase